MCRAVPFPKKKLQRFCAVPCLGTQILGVPCRAGADKKFGTFSIPVLRQTVFRLGSKSVLKYISVGKFFFVIFPLLYGAPLKLLDLF